ncbi:MAG: alpha/beta hydrolase [Acidimicrobiales bacterium]
MGRTVVALALASGLTLGSGATPAAAAAPTEPCRDTAAAGLRVWNDRCGRPVVIYLHAANETVARPLRLDLLEALAAAGWSVVMSDLCGPLNWGSGCAVSELNRLADRYSPGRPVRVVALSMGGAALMNWAERNPQRIGRAVGIVPVTTWSTPWLRQATAGAVPTGAVIPTKAKFDYRVIAAGSDEIVGPPRVKGPHVSVTTIPGAHNIWQRVSAETVLRTLGKP